MLAILANAAGARQRTHHRHRRPLNDIGSTTDIVRLKTTTVQRKIIDIYSSPHTHTGLRAPLRYQNTTVFFWNSAQSFAKLADLLARKPSSAQELGQLAFQHSFAPFRSPFL